MARGYARGWIVAFAGLGINLALGVLYSWSVIAKVLSKGVAEGGWGWSAGQASLPYAICVGVFALSMVFAGRAQDRFGPRLVASVGGALCGAGMIVASFGTASNSLPITAGFGILTGIGIGLGYAAATPAAVKWFPPARKGLITGIVVAGFALASVYIAPLTKLLLQLYGIPGSFRVLGIAFLFVTVGLAQLLVNPPKGYVPAGSRPVARRREGAGSCRARHCRLQLARDDSDSAVRPAVVDVRVLGVRRADDHRPHGEDRGGADGRARSGLPAGRGARDRQRAGPSGRRNRRPIASAGSARCSSSSSLRRP